MLTQERQPAREQKQTTTIEDVFDAMTIPRIEEGAARKIPLVDARRQTDGRDVSITLSVAEGIEKMGFGPKSVLGAVVGDMLVDNNYDLYKVVSKNGKEIKVRRVNKEGSEDDDTVEGLLPLTKKEIKAKEYTYRLRNPQNNQERTISVYDGAFKDGSLDTTDLLDDLMKSLPAACMSIIGSIRLIIPYNPSKDGKFHSEPSITGGGSIITLYVDPDSYNLRDLKETLYHELGHAVAQYIKKDVHPGDKWKRAMAADGNAVSRYSADQTDPDSVIKEDFADTVMLYLATDGAYTGQPRQLRTMASERFALLDGTFLELDRRQQRSVLELLTEMIGIVKPPKPLG